MNLPPARRSGAATITQQRPSRKSRSDGKPTIADVAAQAGVGAITASRALRTPHLVSAALRRSVEDAVLALNYVPNFNARALASKNSDVIGVLIPSLTHSTFTDVLRGIYDGVDNTGLQVQIANTRYDAAEEERLVGMFLRQKPLAMIVSGVGQTPLARRMLEAAGCPVVQIMDVSHDPIDHIIGFSHEHAARRMTEHLIEEGYCRIAFLSGWLNPRSQERLLGYQRALAAAGLTEPCRAHSMPREVLAEIVASSTPSERPILDFSRPSFGRQLFRQALAEAPDLDAVFCNNDSLALGVLFECQARGIRVPEKVGIAGFNDLDFTDATFPSLSSVRTHRYRIGHAAVVAIQDRLAGRDLKDRIVDVGIEVMRRRSTDRRGRLECLLPVVDSATVAALPISE